MTDSPGQPAAHLRLFPDGYCGADTGFRGLTCVRRAGHDGGHVGATFGPAGGPVDAAHGEHCRCEPCLAPACGHTAGVQTALAWGVERCATCGAELAGTVAL